MLRIRGAAASNLFVSGLALGLALALGVPAVADTLKKPDLDQLVAAQQANASPTFQDFLTQAVKTHPKLRAAVAAYGRKAPLAGDDLVNISRLLGLYNRLHNEKAVISSIEAMVAIPTVRLEDVPPHESKTIIEFGQLVEKMAKGFGLQYRNVDNRMFEVKLPGRGKE